MDAMLLALLEDMRRKADVHRTSECLEVRFAALAALEYLGKKIDAEKQQKRAENERRSKDPE